MSRARMKMSGEVVALKRLKMERNGGTYEAAATEKFVKERTETMRDVGEESDAWCAAVNTGKRGAEERELLAAAYRFKLAREAGSAQGVDRHLGT